LKNILYPFPLLITDYAFAAPIYWVEYCQLHQDVNKCEHTAPIFGFGGFFICLQHQHIGGRWLAAAMNWCIINGSVMFAAH
jgi:hypothetical protein